MQIRNLYVQKFQTRLSSFLSISLSVSLCMQRYSLRTRKSFTVLFPLVYGSRYESKKIDFFFLFLILFPDSTVVLISRSLAGPLRISPEEPRLVLSLFRTLFLSLVCRVFLSE